MVMLTRIFAESEGDENGQRILLLYKKNGLHGCIRKIRVLRADIVLESTEMVEALNDGMNSPSSVFVTTDDIIIYDNGIIQFRGDEHKLDKLCSYTSMPESSIHIPKANKLFNEHTIYHIPNKFIFEKSAFSETV